MQTTLTLAVGDGLLELEVDGAIDEPREPEHPSTCEGDLLKIGDPTTWSSWLSIAEPWVETWTDKRGEQHQERHERRQRRFCSHACICRWIDARSHQGGAS